MRTEIIVIVAMAENHIIGVDGDLPWHIAEDLKRFKKLTVGHPCIMGRKTYESLPKRPLPNRINIVISSKERNFGPDVTVVSSLDDALTACAGHGKAFVCGGGAIYNLAMVRADRIEMTRIHREVEGDTRFPDYDPRQWRVVEEEARDGYSFFSYRRCSVEPKGDQNTTQSNMSGTFEPLS